MLLQLVVGTRQSSVQKKKKKKVPLSNQATMDHNTEESSQDLLRIGDLAHQFLAKGAALDGTKYSEFFIPTPKVASFSAILLTRLLHILTGGMY